MISGLSFRPRPLDVNRPIPIFRKELDEPEIEAGTISRSVPSMPTGMEAEDEEEAHIQEAIKQSLSLKPEKIHIPTPTIIVVPGYDDDPLIKPFVRPSTYIHWKELTPEEQSSKVDYDLDPEDAKFLRQLNANKKILTDSKFELIMDRAEKEAARIGAKIPPCSQIEQLVPEIPATAVQSVYNYWVKKRERNNNQPLMYELIEPPDPEDPDPFKPFRKRTDDVQKTLRRSRKNDSTSLVRMKQLRHEMEKCRTLLEMVKKREKLKKDQVEAVAEIFEVQCKQAQYYVKEGPPALPRKKKEKIKTEPKPSSLLKSDIYEFDKEFSEIEVEEPTSEYSPSEGSPPPSPKVTRKRLTLDEELEDNAVVKPPSRVAPPARSRVSMRGRLRVGRGGRILYDRPPPPKTNGIVYYWENDLESNERLNSLVDLNESGFHPLLCGRTDADKLLQKLQAIEQAQNKKRKIL